MLTNYINIFFPCFRFRQEIAFKNENAIQENQMENKNFDWTELDIEQRKKLFTAKDKVTHIPRVYMHGSCKATQPIFLPVNVFIALLIKKANYKINYILYYVP